MEQFSRVAAVILGFARSGRLNSLTANEGDLVAAGGILAKLDSEQLQAKRDKLIRALRLLDEQNGNAGNSASVQDLRQRVRQIQARLAGIESELARPSGAANQSLADRIVAVERQLEALRASWEISRTGSGQGQIARHRGELDELEMQIQSCTLTAPFQGVVARHTSAEGSLVAAGMPVLRLVDTSQLKAVHTVADAVAGEP